MNETAIVYVVDDDEQVRKSLRWLIEPLGLRVISCSDAYQFLDQFVPDATACLVLDVGMPMMSGLDLQELLGNRGVSLPIIFISGHADVPMSVRALKAGAFDFLEKPFNGQVLLDSIQRAIVWARQSREERNAETAIRLRLSSLSERERQVMDLVLAGHTNKHIADVLGITVRTVEAHRAKIMEKMHADSPMLLARMIAPQATAHANAPRG